MGTRLLLERLQRRLDIRESQGNLRTLRGAATCGTHRTVPIDFSSNDYLGLARCKTFAQLVRQELSRVEAINVRMGLPRTGNTGSRLLSGDTWYHMEVESSMATFFQRESALIFNSGYELNLGVLFCLPREGDVVVYDELVHNSTLMGLRANGKVPGRSFNHNDVSHLEAVLEDVRTSLGVGGTIFIAVEALYSMDGDFALLREILECGKRYGACVIVDEAHSTGLCGPEGRGLVCQEGLQDHPALLCCVHTFGKAMGCHGAVYVGPRVLRDFLINYCSPLIFSTTLPVHSLVCMYVACSYQATQDSRRSDVQSLVHLFREGFTRQHHPEVAGDGQWELLDSPSPIQALVVPGSHRVVAIAEKLRKQHGLDIRAVRPPTVPKGRERLRIVLHAHNRPEEVHSMVRVLKELLRAHGADSISERAKLVVVEQTPHSEGELELDQPPDRVTYLSRL